MRLTLNAFASFPFNNDNGLLLFFCLLMDHTQSGRM